MFLDHVGLSVADLDAQASWYSNALGLEQNTSFEVESLQLRGMFLTSPSGIAIELLQRSGSRSGLQASSPAEALLTQGYGHICLRVEGVDSLHAQLVAAGATERMAPQQSPEPGVRMSFVADPEGNLIELLDRKGPVGS